MIVVSGMHRSGTSAIAGLLNELGLEIGDPSSLFAADRWNPRGYFEQRDLLDLNSEIVTGLPRTGAAPMTWLAQLRYLGMPARSRLDARAHQRSQRMRQLAQKYRGCVVKDPRFCLTLSYWIELDAVESLVVCVRDPLEVADSLWRRQWVPRRLGLHFWNYHMDSLLRSASGVNTIFVDYAALVEAGDRELQRLDRFLGLSMGVDECKRRCARAMRAELRHCRISTAVLPPDTARLYAALRARCT